MLLDRFSTPQTALSFAPTPAPAALPVRLAAGPAYRGLVTLEADTTWSVVVEGNLPDGTVPGFAVLVAGSDGLPKGIMLYTGERVRGAPIIGRVAMGALNLPLLGFQSDIAGLEDPNCPFFPDSLARPCVRPGRRPASPTRNSPVAAASDPRRGGSPAGIPTIFAPCGVC
jgi:hypothetical protein